MDCRLISFAVIPNGLLTQCQDCRLISFAVIPNGLLTQCQDCRLISFAVILSGLLTQNLSRLLGSLSNKREAFVWLFCSSSVYESELSSQPRNKKASPIAREGFVAFLGNSLEDFASDINSLMEIRIKIY